MKRVRLIVLTGLAVVALVAAVVPALAHNPVEFNWTFMGDKNSDNVPDKWNVKGDVFRVCDHPYTSYTMDACMMVFPPSNRAAALWQRITAGEIYPSWLVVTEEASHEFIGEAYGATKAFDAYRGYYGVRLTFDDGFRVTVYDMVPYGHNPFGYMSFYDYIGVWGAQYGPEDVVDYTYGFLVTPGDGYLAVDHVTPEHE